FHVEQSFDATWRLERDRDAVDRIGRQGDHAAPAERLDGCRPAAGIVGDDPGAHAEATTDRPLTSTARRSTDSCASRSMARRAAAGEASTSDSIIRATPSSESGGAT